VLASTGVMAGMTPRLIVTVETSSKKVSPPS
jgi:hypothetical protein